MISRMKNKETIFIFVLIVLYVVGIFGALLPIHPDFLLLTPINLLISVGMMLWVHPDKNKNFYIFLLIAFCFGFLIEIIGVQTGFPFGNYQYGKILGPKILGTPPMIGINWLMLVYAVGVFVNTFIGDISDFIKALLGASLLLLLDFIIEPVAIHYGFWTWENPSIPLENYIAWWGISFGLCWAFYKLLGRFDNKVALCLFTLQFIFFGILRIWIP